MSSARVATKPMRELPGINPREIRRIVGRLMDERKLTVLPELPEEEVNRLARESAGFWRRKENL